ncbi:hypothetical protein MXB_1738, partial [Myxobolus squamalis]
FRSNEPVHLVTYLLTVVNIILSSSASFAVTYCEIRKIIEQKLDTKIYIFEEFLAFLTKKNVIPLILLLILIDVEVNLFSVIIHLIENISLCLFDAIARLIMHFISIFCIFCLHQYYLTTYVITEKCLFFNSISPLSLTVLYHISRFYVLIENSQYPSQQNSQKPLLNYIKLILCKSVLW